MLDSLSSFLEINFLFLSLFSTILRSLLAYNKGFNHFARNIIIKLLTALLKNIISTNRKTFIKTANFFYISVDSKSISRLKIIGLSKYSPNSIKNIEYARTLSFFLVLDKKSLSSMTN